jgi:beta-glucosidase
MTFRRVSLLLSLFAAVTAVGQPIQNAAYKDPSLPVEQRVKDLLSRMTVEEKVSQLGHTADPVPRLGIPAYNWWNEGLHGVARAGYATVFPQAIGLAATFDEPLMHRVADTISTEFRAKFYESVHPDGSSDWYRGLTVWSPNINIFRDPRWGRGQETYGEDPYLTSRMGIAFITGLQGNDPKYFKTIATSKHFAVHSGPETTRHSVDVKPSPHDLEDTYLPAFRATVMEGKVQSVMCAYNSVNGQPACANTALLHDHLRTAWGFEGYVVSDCGALSDIYRGHHYVSSIEQAAAAAFKAGTDLVCAWPPESNAFERAGILKAVEQGLLPVADVDRAVTRLLTARFRLGLFDPPNMVPYASIKASENDSEQHRQLALRTAQESIVLLKNDNHLLPLKKSYPTIAVIGPNADSLDALVGNYNGTPSQPVTILGGIRKRFANSKIIYAQGSGLIGPMMKAVPGGVLYTDDSRSTHGLKAEYFANPKLEGEPNAKIDGNIDFRFPSEGATPDSAKNYSVRWTGVLVPEKDGEYQLGFQGQDGYRLWLDNSLLLEDWSAHHPASTVTKAVPLQGGHAYALRVEYFAQARGSEAHLLWTRPGEEGQDAIEAARDADLVVLALGLSPNIEGEEMHINVEGFSGGDRTRIDLPAPQERLLERVGALGKPTILLLLNGSAVAVNWADQHVPAILEAWYPGEEGGTAVAQALAGDFSPAGRLPVTFYKSEGQLPPFDDYSMAKRTYRYFDGEPLYPFGYGLSYTAFQYSDAKLVPQTINASGEASISVNVKNTGAVEGDEVVELYLKHEPSAGAPVVPIRALKGFQRVHLNPGEQKTVTFKLTSEQLRIVDEQGHPRVVGGVVDVWVGGGQPVSRAGQAKPAGITTRLSINGEATF